MIGIQYDQYSFSLKEWVGYIALGLALDAMVAYLFYRSIIAFILLLPLVVVFLKNKRKELLALRLKNLSVEFKEAIMAVSASLNAGYSVENAFIEAGSDLKNMFGKSSPIVKEFVYMAGRIRANENVEDILMDLAKRSGLEDVKDFADVFITAKRSGGDLNNIIRRTAYHIGDKIEVKRDIDTLMSAKKMEQNVMNVIPFLIILYMSVNSPGFLDPLYGNVLGVLVMTGCLMVYGLAIFLSSKIVSVEV